MASTMPRVNYVPIVGKSLIEVDLTEPGSISFPAGQSSFPTKTDEFKSLIYTAPETNATTKAKLTQYHTLMIKFANGTATEADLATVKSIMADIREHVLTEDDLNLMVDSLHKIEEYLYTFLNNDLDNKAAAMDVALTDMITTLNNFMIDLEHKYNQSPTDYPIPDGSVLNRKLEQMLQDAIAYSKGTIGTIVAAAKPALPVSRSIIWIDTNIIDAD